MRLEMDAFGIVEMVGERPACWTIAEKYRSMWTNLVQLGGDMDLATLRHMTEVPSSTPSLVKAAFPGAEEVDDFSGGKEAW